MRIATERLTLSPLSEKDAAFVAELLNTDGWIKNIGDRNIRSEKDAREYIKKVTDNPHITYWTVKLKLERVAIGLVTLIKRDYLQFNDVGFALLPQFFNKGYAFEATKAVLLYLINNNLLEDILAISLKENAPSINMIEKLGLTFEKTIDYDNNILGVYRASKGELLSRLLEQEHKIV
ncbi:GNAT family N-acetyltransferase [Sphingobacterium hotanense]|uniref:GNAT family N-acetyltransferase n=1 Tax=Sphingobacterium hotanense TaxID=649196 RepID=A0ABT7NI89_9SPHI|nr:GNAT family N-acetyltransferase [Sphingobacterium hotanense]MDM1046912.1 GNAT family N-acetyltransferase [Sphingobacterium hotanense]